MKDRTIFILQFISLSFIWVLAVSITWLFIHLVSVADSLQDAQTASMGISILAIIVFWVLAGILSYVFFGLHRREKAGS